MVTSNSTRASSRIAGLGVALVLVAGCTGGGGLPLVGAPPGLPRATGDPAEPPRAPGDGAPQPDPARLAALLAGPLKARELGPRPQLRVADAATGRVLVDQRASAPTTPASTAKLATAVAALHALGPETTLATRVVLAGSRLTLVGGGDPTLAGPASPVTYPPAARLADLAAATTKALGPRARVTVVVDDRLFPGPRTGPGWKPAYVSDGDVAPVSALELDRGRLRPSTDPHAGRERAPDPALHAGSVFAALLRARGVTVTSAPRRGAAAGTEVARAVSPPVRSLVEAMLAGSDNDLAEALGRAVALHRGLPATFPGEAQAVTAEAAAVGVAGLRLVDASGLSPQDRASPAQLVDLVRLAVSGPDPALRWMLGGLPVAGFSGTLADRFRRSPAGLGSVRAKTGTLAGVGTLAGLVVDADGRRLAFAVAAPDSGERVATQRALDALAAVLAGCGCR